MLNWYSVRMSDGKDECWTNQEASSERGACNITQMKWGKPWRAVEAKHCPTFYHVGETATEEEIKLLNEQRRLALIKANSKIVVTPLGEFASITEAAKQYGTRHKLQELMKNNPEEYYYKK